MHQSIKVFIKYKNNFMHEKLKITLWKIVFWACLTLILPGDVKQWKTNDNNNNEKKRKRGKEEQ